MNLQLVEDNGFIQVCWEFFSCSYSQIRQLAAHLIQENVNKKYIKS